MKNARKTKTEKGFVRKSSLVKAILDSNFQEAVEIIGNNPQSVNEIHTSSGMSATMLAAYGRLPAYLEEIFRYGYLVDFTHRDKLGFDLHEIAVESLEPEVLRLVVEAYKVHAPHIINNWPEPN